MQLSQLITAVREEVQDTARTAWTDATITRYLNDAVLDLATDSRVVTTWTVLVFSNNPRIQLPTNLLIPRHFWFSAEGRQLPLQITRGIIPENNLTGTPEAIYILGQQAHLYPIPSSNGTLGISGTARPNPMVLPTDVPGIQDANSALIEFAVWRCLSSDGDPGATPKRLQFMDMRMQWVLLEAQKYPLPNRIG